MAITLKYGELTDNEYYFSSILVEICLLLILSDMTKIDEGDGELIDDVTLEDGLDSRTFLRPEYVRVSRTNLK